MCPPTTPPPTSSLPCPSPNASLRRAVQRRRLLHHELRPGGAAGVMERGGQREGVGGVGSACGCGCGWGGQSAVLVSAPIPPPPMRPHTAGTAQPPLLPTHHHPPSPPSHVTPPPCPRPHTPPSRSSTSPHPQTTNKIFNDELFEALDSRTVLSWQRVRAANWLASSGQVGGVCWVFYVRDGVVLCVYWGGWIGRLRTTNSCV